MTQTTLKEDAWISLQMQLRGQFGKTPDLDAVLFLIGIRELGQVQEKFSKEDKVNLMHIAVCRLLSERGYYRLTGHDADGWPHWEALDTLPPMNLKNQEALLKELAIDYFNGLEIVE